MANFESFRWNISSSINFFFQKSVPCCYYIHCKIKQRTYLNGFNVFISHGSSTCGQLHIRLMPIFLGLTNSYWVEICKNQNIQNCSLEDASQHTAHQSAAKKILLAYWMRKKMLFNGIFFFLAFIRPKRRKGQKRPKNFYCQKPQNCPIRREIQ